MKAYRPDGSDIKIALATVFYQERKNLQRLVESASLDDPFSPDVWFMVDGPFIGFKFAKKKTPNKSDDGSREYLLTIGKVILDDYAGLQNEKRMRYVNLAVKHECDVMIIVDADEYFHPEYTDWKSFRRSLASVISRYDTEHEGTIFNLQMWIKKDYIKGRNVVDKEDWKTYPRVWHKPENVEYFGGIHWYTRHRKKKTKIIITKVTIYGGLRLATDSLLRKYDFMEARDRWAEWQLNKETKLQGQPHLENIMDEGLGSQEDRRRAIRPLMAITQGRDIQQFLGNMKEQFQDVDKLWLKYYTADQAYKKARDLFLKNTHYTHLVLMSDDLLASKANYDLLIDDIVKNGYQVISGWCNFDITKERKKWSNIMLHTLPPEIPHTATLKEYEFATFEEIEDLHKNNGWTVVDVRFAGFPLTVIDRDVVNQITFRGDAGCCHDATFALDLDRKGIRQYCDLRCKMVHLKLNESDVECMQVGKKEPRIKWELRKLI